MDERKIKIAFLDDGIDPFFIPTHVSFKSLEVKNGLIRESCRINGITHGAACFTVFKNYTQAAYELVSIKILDEDNHTGKINDLLAALKWCGLNNMQIIHMSIGTRQFADMAKLYGAVNQLTSCGVIMVAACNNCNTLTYPACFPNVIGVRHYGNVNFRDSFVFLDKPYDNIDIMTCINDVFLFRDGGQAKIFRASNSTAAPFITARVCDYLSAGYAGLSEVKQKLHDDSLKIRAAYDFLFYKQLLLKWKEIDVPVIAVLSVNIPESVSKMMELVKLFISEGYHAVGLSPYVKTNVENSIYYLENFRQDTSVMLNDILNLFFNFAKPDIILFNIKLDLFLHSGCEVETDVFITDQPGNKLLSERFSKIAVSDINKDTPALYNELIKFFNSDFI